MHRYPAMITGLFVCLIATCLTQPAFASDDDGGTMVIANRAAGTISVIDVSTDVVTHTIALPAGDNTPEPMYVVHAAKADYVFVGDRANNRVVVFDDETFEIEATVAAGNGIFHMWADPAEHQLWVNNDIDNTVTVIDPDSLQHVATVPMPADLVALGGKPHDVILDPSGAAAYVTMVGFAGTNDYVVRFDTTTFLETARAPVGKDPHVSATKKNDLLYVPAQNSNEVSVLNRADLSLLTTLSVPGAHGAGMPRKGKTFYVSNLPGGGANALFAIDTKRNELVGGAVDTPFPVPHNLALNRQGDKLYVTHSGATSDQVSVFDIDKDSGLPVFKTTVTVGYNPFGLAFVR